jgi:hypothetical protein
MFFKKIINTPLGRFTTVDPIKDGNNWYAYVGNNPVNFVDPLGLDETEVINLQGSTLDFYEDYLDEQGYPQPQNAEELADILRNLPDDMESLIFAGGHGTKRVACMGEIIYASDLAKQNVDLNDDIQVYLITCYQGNFEERWANVLGVPVENVHGFEGSTLSYTSYELVRDVKSGGSIEVLFENKKGTDDLYQNFIKLISTYFFLNTEEEYLNEKKEKYENSIQKKN